MKKDSLITEDTAPRVAFAFFFGNASDKSLVFAQRDALVYMVAEVIKHVTVQLRESEQLNWNSEQFMCT